MPSASPPAMCRRGPGLQTRLDYYFRVRYQAWAGWESPNLAGGCRF